MAKKERAAGKRKTSKMPAGGYWLFKTEPNVYSIQDLAGEKKQTTYWDGVRNYQARNLLRDEIHVGDGVLLYHSRVQPMAIVGTAEIVKAGYPDHTAFDANDPHYDPKSDPDDPVWYMVDIRLVQIFAEPLPRDILRACPELADMMLLRRGARLSIQPVTAAEWNAVHEIAQRTKQ